MLHYYNYNSTDNEKRRLRINLATTKRGLTQQQDKNKHLEQENKRLKQEKRKSEEELEKAKREIEKLRRERDMYRKMLFKKNTAAKALEEKQGDSMHDARTKRGRQCGHPGVARSLPTQEPDQVKRVRFSHCPTCQKPLMRTDSSTSHTVEDIPEAQQLPVVVTRYEKERQWCEHCHKEVVATAPEELPGSRFGIHLIVYIMLLKYGCKMSLAGIVFLLFHTYKLQISTGTLIQTLHRASEYLGDRYDQIADAIRAAPVKHADETGWRVNGVNSWVWDFLTTQEVYITIEGSRGGGIPKQFLADSHIDDVLVRDDYAGYKNLPMHHQSCWAHLLRKSSDAAEDKEASEEVKQLHALLTALFSVLKETVSHPFDQTDREQVYQESWTILTTIIASRYTHEDAQAIQTRIRNQGKNLITALLHDTVPLTNNLAERSLRPLVVQRKISGGSRSWAGAKTTAVNTSVYQTIQLQQLPLVPTLKDYLLTGATGKR